MEALQTRSEIGRRKKFTPETVPAEGESSQDGLWVSESEYWEKYYHDPDFSYEWNNGYLEVKPVSDYSGFLMYRWFIEIITDFLNVNPIAKLIGLDIGFRLAFPGNISIRKPDLAVILNGNPKAIRPRDFSYRGTYDLCIEFLSYSSSKEVRRDTVQKKREYEGAGILEYYILDPRGLETTFYRLSAKGKYRKINPSVDGVIQSQVLPGFQFRIGDLYSQPSLTELTEDTVYKGYARIEYQMEKMKVEQERMKVEEVEKLLIMEKSRAEKLAEKLRALGISPDEI